MKEIPIPDCIANAFRGQDLPPGSSLYYLHGAGRALSFARMSAKEFDTLGNQQKIAEYHSYCGISACRTAIDAMSNWLNETLEIHDKQGTGVDLAKSPFRKTVTAAAPGIESVVNLLACLAQEIDPYRQAWQHREGIAMIYHGTDQNQMIEESAYDVGATDIPPQQTGRWHIALKGLEQDRTEDKDASQLLHQWADQIERALCDCIQLLTRTSS